MPLLRKQVVLSVVHAQTGVDQVDEDVRVVRHVLNTVLEKGPKGVVGPQEHRDGLGLFCGRRVGPGRDL